MENNSVESELAKINVVSSPALVSLVSNTAELSRLQETLGDQRQKATEVMSILVNTQPHELSKEVADYVDRQLSDINALTVNGDQVQGVESLGFTMSPQEFLKTRRMGCESFLSGLASKTAFVGRQLAAAFKDAWILLRENNDSVMARLALLESDLEANGSFKAGTQDILLGYRLYNLFKVNKEVKEDWTAQVSKIGKLVSGLSQNYYVLSKNNLNTTMSYFGGFDKLSDPAEALKRYLLLPVSIPSVRFKECTIQDRSTMLQNVACFRSVEMMGGRYFVDTRKIFRTLKMESIADVGYYLTDYLETDKTYLNPRPEKEENLQDNQNVMSLGSDEIKELIKISRAMLKDWEKVYKDGEKHAIEERDYNSVFKELEGLNVDDELKTALLTAFTSLVTKNQRELLELRSRVSTYLVFLLNGLIELSYTSIKLNQE